MLHLLSDNLKKLRICQMIIFITFIIKGCFVMPFIILSYFIFYNRNRKIYKKCIHILANILWTSFVYVIQWWNRLRVRIYATEEDFQKLGQESSLVIMNHKYDIDWLALWVIADKLGIIGGGVSVAKYSLRYVPFMGWTGLFNGALFLHRNWEKDKDIIIEKLKNFNEHADGYYNYLVLYPEGTRFTKAKQEASNEVARQKNLPELKHCLLPRTRGFVEIVKQLKPQISTLYDITIGFPESIENPDIDTPKQPPFTLNGVLKNKIHHGNFHIRRIPMSDLPDEPEEIANWLQKAFQEKDKIFDEFARTGKFPGPSFMMEPNWSSLLIYLTVFLAIWIPFGYWIISIILFGSFYSRIFLFIFFLIMAVTVHFLKNETKTEKGSTYGVKNKTN